MHDPRHIYVLSKYVFIIYYTNISQSLITSETEGKQEPSNFTGFQVLAFIMNFRGHIDKQYNPIRFIPDYH
jgi:hypothetical protein